MHLRTRPGLGRCLPLAAALLGSAALASPAGAAVANISDIIEVSSNTSEVLIGGVENANVELRRNGVVLATGTATGPVGGGEAGLNSDHAPGGCWNGFVPQMLPGDEVHNVTNTDFIVLGDVKVTSAVTEENGAVVFRGTVGALPAGHGLDATLDPATEGFRWADGSSGGQFLSAAAGDSGGSITEHGDGTWTARWTGLTGVEKQQALGGEPGANVGIEHDIGPTGGEITAFHFGATPGGHGGCSEPFAPNEVSSFDRSVINSHNAGSALVVNGKSQPGVTSVLVTLTDKNGTTATRTVTPAGGAWSASFAGGDFADGAINAGVQMTMAGGEFAGVGSSISKDTVAPGAPTASVAAGTYQQGINVALTGENVRYTTDGSTPTAASQAYSSAIRVNQSQTVKAVSVDAAGNTSPVAEFAYTIQAPAVVAPIVRTPGTVVGPGRLRLASLSVARQMRLRTARRLGVRARILAPAGAKAVRVRMLRGNKTIASVVRRVSANRALVVVLPRTARQRRALRRGTYRLQITPGTSTRTLNGATSTRRITLR